jgi:hypothetical protein
MIMTYSRREVADMLALDPDTVDQLAAAGKLSAIRITPNTVRFLAKDVCNFLVSCGANPKHL